MISHSIKKRLTFFLFKIASLVHAMLLLTEVILHTYYPKEHSLFTLIDAIDHLTMLCISIIICIKAMLIFASRHKQYNQKHQSIALTAEVSIAGCLLLIFILNSTISKNFILFIGNLAVTTQDNKILFLFLLIILYLLTELLDSYNINQKSIQDVSIFHTIRSKFFDLIIKASIIITILIGHLPLALTSLSSLLHLSDFTHDIILTIDSTIFRYLKTIIIILISLWILLGMYQAYKLYQKK